MKTFISNGSSARVHHQQHPQKRTMDDPFFALPFANFYALKIIFAPLNIFFWRYDRKAKGKSIDRLEIQN